MIHEIIQNHTWSVNIVGEATWALIQYKDVILPV